MEAHVLEWLNLLGRWLHLVAGIAWIGASFYFVWLDNHLVALKTPAEGVSGELWAVHGGGFYNARKYPLGPQQLPEPLHWFKWEAYTTWLSGFFMLCLVYYVQADAYLIDRQVADIGRGTAIAIGLGTLAGGWIVYDLLCRSPLGWSARGAQVGSRDGVLAAVLAVLLAAAAWGLCQVFSGRGAYLHFGAMLGTIMVANVFFVIIPGQRELVKARGEGRSPEAVHGLRAKQRSVHNTYFTLPVLFTMISNHYAGTYGSAHNWVVLVGVSAAGVFIRAWFVARHKAHAGRPAPLWPLAGGLAALAAIVISSVALHMTDVTKQTESDQSISWGGVQAIVAQRCAGCHAAAPTQAGFTAAPKGVLLDRPDRILAQLQLVRQQLETRTMPIGNLTGMTDEERAQLIAWIDRGAPH